jgi:hypothetical protein
MRIYPIITHNIHRKGLEKKLSGYRSREEFAAAAVRDKLMQVRKIAKNLNFSILRNYQE